MIEFGHGTHTGLRRSSNEDTCCADVAMGLFLVADGMGGHAHGERAAALARDGVCSRVGDGQPLQAAIEQTNHDIFAQHGAEAGGLPMGTTIAALHITGSRFEAAWVGDSRIYALQDGTLHALSHDQSLVQRMVDCGVLDASEATRDPRRNVLTQALGVTAPTSLQVGTMRGRIERDMQFLLCSDGLTEGVDDAALAGILNRHDIGAQEAVDHLILAALDAGGSDNVTVIVIRCRDA